MLPRRRERSCLESRAHGIVLARPFAKAFVAAAAGGFAFSRGWPWLVGGAVLLGTGALVALQAVWRWERTRLVVTPEQLAVVSGTFRRRTVAVRLERVGGVRVEQTLTGRLLGYGTLVAGDVSVEYVPRPWEVSRLVEELPLEPALSS
ncbi:MAG: PH domain-containing protein [Actinomycetota bacterium]|nr:PH domain-containing protein [Actinomycetota bacterium]